MCTVGLKLVTWGEWWRLRQGLRLVWLTDVREILAGHLSDLQEDAGNALDKNVPKSVEIQPNRHGVCRYQQQAFHVVYT